MFQKETRQNPWEWSDARLGVAALLHWPPGLLSRSVTAAFGLLLLGVGLGAVLRFGQTLSFGWAALALFTLFLPGASGLVLAALGGVGVVSAQAWAAARFGLHAQGPSRNSSLSEAS